MKSFVMVCLVLAAAGSLSSCGSAAKPAPGMGCALNSDCATGLTCTFGLCHSACVVNGDCPTGQLCVKSGAVGEAGTINVCQLPKELTCVYNSDCKSPLVCARDEACRNECQSDVDCVSPQVCTTSKVCALTSQLVPGTNDVTLVTTGRTDGGGTISGTGGGTATGTGGGAGTTGQGGSGGSGGAIGTGGSGGTTCAGPQLEFANISQGDANPGFNSSVAVRNADTLFIFSAYDGPAPVDGGTDGGALAGDAVFVQMFDPVSGNTRGPNKFLFSIPYGVVAAVEDVSVAPTGEIALLYYVVASANNYADALYLTVLGTTPADGGVAGLSVKKTVQLESAANGDGHIIWQTASQLFVPSWKYLGSNGTWYVRARKYHPDGTAAGTAINAFPTTGNIYQPNQEDDGDVGASGGYLGMAYQSTNNNWPYLTIVDSDGFQVGPIVSLNPGGVDNWVAGAGTTQGFVTMFNSSGRIYGSFVPLTGMNSVISDAGAADAGLAPLPMFSFTSTALTGKVINDDAGGAGGVGAVLLEDDGAAFVYVTADSSKQYTEGTVISSSGGIQAGISNFQGSFVVSLFNNTTHATQATVSTCP